jgi:hypothetical protein
MVTLLKDWLFYLKIMYGVLQFDLHLFKLCNSGEFLPTSTTKIFFKTRFHRISKIFLILSIKVNALCIKVYDLLAN